ncbi:hypothetical protein BLA29_013062 [Euroglyphus maynei]|uniref:Uncharacterized protein n=1 Tax=Euroglyphus maynei TaxID=6958 RepID=A0A1Y3AQ40_EURMA|nr:hypothetical protein BLA29_013062 [Euroglyphus maynei]
MVLPEVMVWPEVMASVMALCSEVVPCSVEISVWPLVQSKLPYKADNLFNSTMFHQLVQPLQSTSISVPTPSQLT